MYAHSTQCMYIHIYNSIHTFAAILCCACRLLYSRQISLCKCHRICYPPQGHSWKSSSPCGCESTTRRTQVTQETQVRGCRSSTQSAWSLTTRTDFPSLHCLLVAPFLSSIEALQFLARALQTVFEIIHHLDHQLSLSLYAIAALHCTHTCSCG